MIIFLKKYKSKIALMVFICVLVCTVSCLLDFKTTGKAKNARFGKEKCVYGRRKWWPKILLLRILTKP